MGERYLKLQRLAQPFSLEEAATALGMPKRRASVSLSRMRRFFLLIDEERGRYRLLPAEKYHRLWQLFTLFPQLEPLKPLVAEALPDMVALVLGGSRARGTARQDSDFDITLIVKKPAVRERLVEMAGKLPAHIQVDVFTKGGFDEGFAEDPVYFTLSFLDGEVVYDTDYRQVLELAIQKPESQFVRKTVKGLLGKRLLELGIIFDERLFEMRSIPELSYLIFHLLRSLEANISYLEGQGFEEAKARIGDLKRQYAPLAKVEETYRAFVLKRPFRSLPSRAELKTLEPLLYRLYNENAELLAG